MIFSELAEGFGVPTNRLYQARDARVKAGRKILDLVSGNVNAHGIAYPALGLERAVRQSLAGARHYRPHPLGQPAARRAISRFYKSEGVSIPEDQLVLTPGTSVSYWYCFKLLASPGDEVLCPMPSYPLFESIAALAGITLTSYPLVEGERWSLDLGALERKITSRTKAIVVISPHNPTGAVATPEEMRGVADIAVRHQLAVIHDEVFSPFLFSRVVLPRAVGSPAPLVLTLNGFSKMLALAGVKIGWIGVTGAANRVQKALRALEMISDTFLPVNEWAQAAVPGLFKEGRTFLESYRRLVRERSETAAALVQGCKGLSAVAPEGGFFMTVRVDGDSGDEEEWALRLLNEQGMLVHPGYFYDMPGRHFIMTTVAAPSELRRGFSKIRKILRPGQLLDE